jgi:hypothetical protein
MDEKTLLEITRQTVDEADRILRMDNSEYIKEFGCESDRTDKAKIEKTVNMLSTLHFFLDQYYKNDSVETGEDEKIYKSRKKALIKATPINED